MYKYIYIYTHTYIRIHTYIYLYIYIHLHYILSSNLITNVYITCKATFKSITSAITDNCCYKNLLANKLMMRNPAMTAPLYSPMEAELQRLEVQQFQLLDSSQIASVVQDRVLMP